MIGFAEQIFNRIYKIKKMFTITSEGFRIDAMIQSFEDEIV